MRPGFGRAVTLYTSHMNGAADLIDYGFYSEMKIPRNVA